MFKIHILYQGLRDLQRGLKDSPELKKGFTSFARVITKYWRDRYRRNARGAQWEPLADKTVRDKERRGLVGDPEWILTETGQLYRGIEHKLTAGGALLGYINASEAHVDPSGEHTRLITVAQLAAIHNEGEGNMPQRVIINDPPERTVQRATKALDEEGIAYLVRRTGGQ